MARTFEKGSLEQRRGPCGSFNVRESEPNKENTLGDALAHDDQSRHADGDVGM